MTKQYMTEADIRDNLRRRCQGHRAAVSRTVLEAWVASRVRQARRDGVLVTEQQRRDFDAGRSFEAGDRARYVGETVDEPVPPTGELIKRRYGQLGKITDVEGKAGQRVVRFVPDAEAGRRVVALVVREGTPGWWKLERVP